MSPAAALVWAMNFSSERSLEAAVGGRFETLVGVVPDTSFSDTEASVAFAVVPVAGLHLMHGRTELTVVYRPRLFWRFPNPVNFSRPLLLHQAGLDHSYQLSPRTTWTNGLDGSIGEIDYALASLVYDPSQPSVPSGEITKIVRVNASSGIGHQLTGRASTGMGVSGSYNSPLDTSDTSYIRSAEAGLTPYYGYRVTSRDAFTLGAGVGYAWFENESTYLAVTPNLQLSHDFSRRTSGSLGGGVAYMRVMETTDPDGPAPGDTDFSPTADLSLKSRVYGKRGESVETGVFAQYQWYFDPVLGRPVQRAGGGLLGAMELAPDWTAGLSVSFFTTVGEDEFATTEEMDVVRQDQTMLRIDAPISYDINPLLGLEFGVRSNLRGPPIADGLAFTDVEFWAYGALRIVFDPKDKDQGWTH